MPVVRIEDLAQVMLEELAPRFGHRVQDVRIDIVGPRAGEKTDEELLHDEEVRRTLELERYFVVVPAVGAEQGAARSYRGLQSGHVDRPYKSSTGTPQGYALRLLIEPGHAAASARDRNSFAVAN
jgi:FlaA1/EpsC-like NDP-sugar epimerase